MWDGRGGGSNPGKRIVFVAFARSISQTLSVFSASFWPEWRANNCRRGNVRGLGNLHAANFAKLHRGSSAHLHKCNQKGGIKLGYLGRSFCRRTFLREARFVKVPFIAALFQPLGPKLILVLKITQRDLDYVFWKGAENPPDRISLFYLCLFCVEHWHSAGRLVQNPTEFEQNAKSQAIMDQRGINLK